MLNINPDSASSVVVTNDTSTNSTFYPLFSNGTSGIVSTYVSSSKLNYNPSTGLFSTTGNFKTSDGAAFSWGSQTTYLLGSSAGNTLGAYVGSTKIWEIVGSGTTTFSYPLVVVGNINTSTKVTLGAVGTAQDGLVDSYFGYSSTYRIARLGSLGANRAISLGVDVTSNPSGSFNGNEIIIPSGVSIIAPNAVNNGYVGVLKIDASNNIVIGGTSFALTTPYLQIFTASGDVAIPTTKKFLLDGSSTGNTYLTESSADVLDVYAGGVNTIKTDPYRVSFNKPIQTNGMTFRGVVSTTAAGPRTNGYKITTAIPQADDSFVKLHIHGYDYRAGIPIDLSLSFYNYNSLGGLIINYSIASNSNWTPACSIGYESGYVVIFFDLSISDGYYAHFVVDVNLYSGSYSKLQGWTVTDAAYAGTGTVTPTYNNSFGYATIKSRLTVNSGVYTYFDGGGDTYVRESSANVLDFYTGGTNSLKVTSTYLGTSGNVQSVGLQTSWGSTNGTLTGAVNAIMGTGANATWLVSGTSGGTFRAGIQALDGDGTLRFYQGANYFSFSAGTITATTFAGNASTATNVAWSGVTSKPTTVSGFGITDFYSTNSTGVTAADSATTNGLYYTNPVSQMGQTDGALYVQAYSSSWVGQIYQDYRTGQISLRSKNNGTWTHIQGNEWRKVWDSYNNLNNGWTPLVTGLRISHSTSNGVTFTKISGASPGWDASVYSAEGYVVGAIAQCSPGDTTSHIMFGLNSDPSTDSSYGSIDYAIYFNAGTLGVYESSSSVYSSGTYVATDVFTVYHDGTYIRYLKNNVEFYKTARATSTTKLYLDSSFYEMSSSITNLQFGLRQLLGNNLWVGTGAESTSTRQSITIGNDGYAAPSNANSLSNGDKLVFWNGATLKLGIGIETGTLWLQGTGGTGIKMYTGTGTSPVLAVTINGDQSILAAGTLKISGTTKAAGYFDAGTTAPTNTTRLNYDGYLYATRFYGDGSQLTNLPAASGGSSDMFAFAAAYG